MTELGEDGEETPSSSVTSKEVDTIDDEYLVLIIVLSVLILVIACAVHNIATK